MISCKREINISIEDKPPVLVVDAMLLKDSLMSVTLSWTQNITDNGPKKVESNATIELYDEDTSILDVLNHKGNGFYQSGSYKPVPDKVYLFKISATDKVYWVNERMPDTLRCVLQDTSRIIFQGREDFFQINLRIDDPSHSENFYGLRLKRHYDEILGQDTMHLSEWVKLESIEFILTEDAQIRFSNQHLVFSDRYFNGNKQYLRFGTGDLFNKGKQIIRAVELYVSSYSVNGYNYYSSVNEHLFYQNDPFSQPTLIRGNVPGAFGGVIGDYTVRYLIKF